MSAKLSAEERFALRWPEFFSYVRCGYSIPDRWEPLLWHLCAAIEWELKKVGRPLSDLTIHQVKGKFGGLRFYYSVKGADNELDRTVRAIRKLVDDAESKSWEFGDVKSK